MSSAFVPKLSRLRSLAKFLLPRRSRLGLVSFVLLGAGVAAALMVPTFFGNADTVSFLFDNIAGLLSTLMMWVAQMFISMATFILKFVVEIAGYKGYIDSEAVKVGWVMVRDVTNMFFVVILLLIAFGTILGVEQYEWKKLLVKFIFAAILVNFSRIITGVFIDVAQVFMTTFINGVAAVAGGNFVTAFKLDKVMELTTTDQDKIKSGSMFLAAIGALAFSAIAMVTIGVYLFMLLARVIALWVLIVLSPLAFVLSVIPQTQKYASDWWHQFGNYVVSGPIVVFFLWLSFVVVGTGKAHDQIRNSSTVPESSKIGQTDLAQSEAYATRGLANTLQNSKEVSGISTVMEWPNMANFAIAVGILLAGAKAAQQLGVAGGAAMSKAVDFGKKAALVGSGVAAGMWLGRKGMEGAKKGAKYGALGLAAVPYYGLGIDSRVKVAKAKVKGWVQAYKAKQLEATTPLAKGTILVKEKKDGKGAQSKWIKVEDYNRERGRYEVEKDEKGREQTSFLVRKYRTEKVGDKEYQVDRENNLVDEDGVVHRKKDDGSLEKTGKTYGKGEVKSNLAYTEGSEKELEGGELVMENEDEMKQRAGWYYSLTGKRAQSVMSAEKGLEKSEGYVKKLQERIKSETEGRPAQLPFSNRIWVDAEDRVVEGMIKTNKARAGAKTEQYSAMGEQATLGNRRFKDGKYDSRPGAATMAETIAGHKERTTATQAQIKELTAAAQHKFLHGAKGKQVLQAKIMADLKVKTLEAEHHALESREMTRLAKGTAEGIKAIKEKVSAEERTKADEAALKSFESGARRRFLVSEEDIKEDVEEEAKKRHFDDKDEKNEWIEGETQRRLAIARYGKTDMELREEAVLEPAAIMLEGAEKEEYIQKKIQELKDAGAAKTGYGVLADQQKWAQRAKRGDAITKEMEKRAQQTFQSSDIGKKWLKDQQIAEAVSKTIQDTLSAIEKTVVDAALEDIMREGASADVEALKKELEARRIHCSAATTIPSGGTSLVDQAEKLQGEITAYDLKIKSLKDKIEVIKDEKGKTALTSELEDEESDVKVNKMFQKRQQLKETNQQIDSLDNQDPDIIRRRGELRKEATEKRSGSTGYLFARAKALETESGRFLGVLQNSLLSNVADHEVHNKRGLVTPNTAITQLIEQYEKDYNQMTYEQVVANMRDNLKEMSRRRQNKEEITEADKAAMAGLFKHAFNNGWVDDAIIAIMSDDTLSGMANETFGWTDQVFNRKKINQIQSLFATGADTEFAKLHSVVGDIMDTATEDLGLSYEQFFSAWKRRDQDLIDNLKRKGHSENQIVEVFGGSETDASANRERYLEVQRKSQAQLQLLGNLRDQAISTNHAENAGHAQYRDIGGGEALYIMAGQRAAREYVYSDLNKTDVRLRAAQHTHTVADIDEEDGLVDNVRENDFALVRNGIAKPGDRTSTNGRFENQMAGIGAMERSANYVASSGTITNGKGESVARAGAFMITGTTTDGKESSRLKSMRRRRQSLQAQGSNEQEQQRQAAVNYTVENIFARQIRGNPRDFLMTMAKKSGIDEYDAAEQGLMHLIVSVGGEEKYIDNINTLIGLYNKGTFALDGVTRPQSPLTPYSGQAVSQRANKRRRRQAGPAGAQQP